MKELSIEEKAKRYDEALEKARQLCAYPTSKPFISDLQDLFPELVENDGERIRKAIINFLHEGNPFKNIKKETRQRWIAWLEKQGEHAKFRDSIQVGDKVTRNEDGVLVNLSQLNRVAKKDEKQGEQKPMKTCAEYYNKDRELKMPVLSEFQDKLADILMHREYVGPDETEDDIAKGRLEYELAAIRLSEELLPLAQKEQKPWSEEDDRMMNDTLAVIDWYAGKHKNISVKLSNWLKSIKNRVQPKQEWSEEDEANLDYFIDFCNGYYNGNKPVLTESTARSLSNWLYRLKSCEIMSKTNKIDNKEAEKTIHLACEFIRHRMESNGNIGGVDYAELIKRLKSLKERYTWKPSDEQITWLYRAADEASKDSRMKQVLNNLLSDLKKLREE